MKPLKHIDQKNLLIMLLFGGLLPVFAAYALGTALPEWSFNHHTYHAVIEGAGAFSAIIIAALIRILRNYEKLPPNYIWLATGLTGMGILDGFHAALLDGETFVWLHSIATLVGGVFFAMVWLPENIARGRFANSLPLSLFIIGFLVSAASILNPHSIPTMIVNGEFTVYARSLNIIGGVGFLAAASYFIVEKKITNPTDRTIFSTYSFLFGVAGLIFELSSLWDSPWWLWHLLRLAAYMIAVYYFFIIFNRHERDLKDAHANLEKKVENRARELQASEQKYRILLEAIPQKIFYKDKDSVYVTVNSSFAADFDLEPKNIIGKNDYEIYPKELAEKYRRDDRHVIETGTSITVDEPTLIHGQEKFVNTVKTPVYNEEGEIIGLLGVFWDITERKQAEETLQESEERFRVIAETSPVGIVITRISDGTILFCNDKMGDMYATPTKNLIGRKVEEFFFDPKERYDLLEQWRDKGSVRDYERRFKGANGTQGWAIISTQSAVYDKEQVLLTGLVDITERKRAEEHIKSSLSEKEVLLQEIHHRVKNNLQVVSSMLSLQSRAEQDDKVVAALQESKRRIEVMARVHESLYQSPDLSHIQVEAFLKTIVSEELLNLSNKKNLIALNVEIEKIPLDVDTATTCGQIVSELASNSFKHAFPDGRKGVVTVTMRSTSKGNIEFSVMDDGVGLPESLDWQTSRSIGLKLVKTLAKKIDGEISVSSENGTCVCVSFKPQGAL